MDDWKSILVELAKKLTPPLAFAVLLVAALGWFGRQIPADYVGLVYAVGLGVPLLWAAVELAGLIQRARPAAPGGTPSSQVHVGQDVRESVFVQGNCNKIQYIVNNYAKDEMKDQKATLETQLRDYLDWVQESFGSITLRGIEQEGRQVVTLPLESVYVPLQAEASAEQEFAAFENPEKMRQRMEKEPGSKQITLNQVLLVGKRVIITGGPGCGKTTVLQHIAWTLARAIRENNPAQSREKLGLDELPLPIYVPLSLYAAYRRDLPRNASGKDKALATFISNYLLQRQMHLSLNPDFLAALLRDGRDVILLLDGLDEVPNEDERARIRQAIEDLTAGREELRALVTSRVAAYRGSAVLGRGFRPIRVLPLEAENVRELVHHAYRSIYKKSAAQARDKADALLADIERLEAERRERLGEGAEPFVDSPLMVRMLLIVHFNNRRLPDQRADLYQKAVDAMLRPDYNLDQDVSDELEHRMAGSLAMNREMLQYLAYHMHAQGQEQGREIEEDSLRSLLGGEPTYAPYVEALIAQTRERGTLLEERGGLYRFIHLSFQEFLTGRYFVEAVRDVDKIAARFEDGLAGDSWWREPLLLTVGYLDLTAPVMARRLLLRLAGADEGCAARDGNLPLDQCLSAAELAASAYLECKSQQPDVGAKLKTRLLDLHRRGQTEKWTPLLMANAADTLDELGYVPEDLYAFIEIAPNAEVRMQKDEFRIPHSAFCISKYPVTNAQYARFLEAGDFHEEKYWLAFPKFLEPEKNYARQGDWGNQGYQWLRENWDERKKVLPRYWTDPRFGLARKHAPLVGVSWYEANAYCRWLMENWETLEEGQQGLPKPAEIRLPTEAEWVLAASPSPQGRGARGEGGRFAFGELENPEEEITQFANTAESGINRTTPVWMYPQGKSLLYNIMDMSGNVWEWQANFYDSAGYPAWRGGSWDFNVDLARVSGRYWSHPYFRDYGLGFRVVLAPQLCL